MPSGTRFGNQLDATTARTASHAYQVLVENNQTRSVHQLEWKRATDSISIAISCVRC
jgi:hypothetical protein